MKKVLAQIEKKLPVFNVPEVINTQEEYKTALDNVARVKKAYKLIEEKRDFYAKPHYNTYKEIRKAFRPYLDQLSTTEPAYKRVMLDFHQSEQKRLDAEQAKIEEEALKNAKEGEAVEVEEVNNIKRVEAIHGVSSVRKTKKWRVIDITKIPLEYLMIDEKKVKEALKIGKSIEGIEEYIEESLAITT